MAKTTEHKKRFNRHGPAPVFRVPRAPVEEAKELPWPMWWCDMPVSNGFIYKITGYKTCSRTEVRSHGK